MMKKLLVFLLVLLCAIGAAACGGTVSAPETTPDAAQGGTGIAAPEPAAEEGTVYPLTVKDASGTEMTFEKAPERIVSIAPSATEVLFAVGAGSSVAGVDDWSDYPTEAASLPKVGGLDGNVEAILALEPDLVIAGYSMSTAVIEELRRLGITVYAFEPDSLDAIIAHIREVGTIVDHAKDAEAVAAKMEADRATVAAAVGGLADADKRSVYIEFSPGWTVGKGEFMDEIIAEAGGVNVADQEGWYEISEEKMIEANPNVIIYSAGVEGLEDTIKSRAGWTQIDAIVNGRVFAVDDNKLSRTGPRVTEALIDVAKAIYPEKF